MWKNQWTYFFWIITNGSLIQSLMSMVFRFSSTSGRSWTISQPKCEKNNPRPALCGSACVSWYLWCTRWSCTQTQIPIQKITTNKNQWQWTLRPLNDTQSIHLEFILTSMILITILMSNRIEESQNQFQLPCCFVSFVWPQTMCSSSDAWKMLSHSWSSLILDYDWCCL